MKPWVLEVPALKWPVSGWSEGDLITGVFGWTVRVLEVLPNDPSSDGRRLLVEDVAS